VGAGRLQLTGATYTFLSLRSLSLACQYQFVLTFGPIDQAYSCYYLIIGGPVWASRGFELLGRRERADRNGLER